MFTKIRQKRERRPKRKQKISYGRKIRYNWNTIESLNYGFEIARDCCYVDDNGYLRWKESKRLCHRDIAYNHVYKNSSFPNPFANYDVHHQDGNRFNNNPNNLSIIFREQHEVEHGKVIYEHGKKFIRLVPAHRRRKQTRKAILIGGKRGQWYPKSQLIERHGFLYATEWIFKKKN